LLAVFLDTSALVKYYHSETGSLFVENLFEQNERKITISMLGLLEIQSAFAMKVRTGYISSAEAGTLRLRLMLDVASGTIQVVAITPRHFSDAALLLSRHAHRISLRTLDALQLAVALELFAEGDLQSFVTADQRLLDAARLEGLPVLDAGTSN
jgi:predicted nucleic acid-binding protein